MALTRLQSDLEAREESVDLTPPRGDAATAKVNSVDNLPQELSSFVGRNHEIASCLELLESSRIVTLTGAGGIGKSRLALRVAASARPNYRDGVWLVELGSLTDPKLVPETAARAIGMHERQGETILQTLVWGLRARQLLLVLDDCEHLVGACTELAESLLRTGPELRILATSREPLHSPGEVAWRVPSLGLPEPGDQLDAAAARDAVRLFLQRARAVAPGFELTHANYDAVVDIVRRLDGVPLALELASARLKALTVEQLRARLEDRLKVLIGGTRTALPRQQTLRATIEWSYGLLDERERNIFEQLSVFAGGWTLEAAELVCADNGTNADDVLLCLEHLIDKSLVVAQESGSTVRYRLLETLRQFASERRQQRPDCQQILQRHFDWILAAARQIVPADLSPYAIANLEPEEENIRAALRWSVDSGELDMGLRLAVATAPLWNFRGRYSEGRTWLGALLPALSRRAAVRSPERWRGLKWDGMLAFGQGELPTAEARIVEGLELSRARKDPPEAPLFVELLANIRGAHGQLAESVPLYLEARQRYRDLGLGFWEAVTLGYLAHSLIEIGDLEGARNVAEECVALGEGHEFGYATSRALRVLGRLAAHDELHERASQLLELALAQHAFIGDVMGEIHTLRYQAMIALDRNEPSAAAGPLSRALAIAESSGDLLALAACLEATAGVFCALRPQEAACLIGRARRLRQASGGPAWPDGQAHVDRWTGRLHRILGADAFAEQISAGERLGNHEAATSAREWLASLTATGVAAMASPGDRLTTQQQQIAMRIVHGCTNQQIAQELAISVTGVRGETERILEQLGLHSRAQIAAWAVANQLEEPAPVR
jgi:predicted ATPase/DNA-binding CsgD family transcriptional regulator